MSSIPTVTPLPPGWWHETQRRPMMSAYTLVNVGSGASHVTVIEAEAAAAPQATSFDPRETVMVTAPAVAGQVKVGEALAGLSNVPAVALQANTGAVAPADAVAERAIVALVSSGAADKLVTVSQTTVVPVTMTDPASGAGGAQASVTETPTAVPAVTVNAADPLQSKVPPTVVAVSVIR